MRLNKLTASFGMLKNGSLSLHPGLNVIFAPNESGKSTWCAFIRAMLYGMDSAERARAGYLPDKLRYAPWSGAPMEGSIELTANGRDMTLTRTTRSKAAPMREFSAEYTGTGIPVDGMNALNAGEQLTGVTAAVFRRSAFIGQGAVAVTGSPELEKRISAIVSTGEEETSYSQADERLRAWQRKRRFNRRGLLPELELKIDSTQSALAAIRRSGQDIEQLERSLEDSRLDCERLEAAVTDSRKRQRRAALERLNAGRARIKASSDAHDAALEALCAARSSLHSDPFGSAEESALEAQITEDMEELERLRAESRKRVSALPAILCFILAAVCAGVYSSLRHIPLIIAALCACVGAIALMFAFTKKRRAAQDAAAARRQLLKKYRANHASDISAALERHRELSAAVKAAQRRESELLEAYDKAKAVQEQLERATLQDLDFAEGSTEAARLSRQLNAARAGSESLANRIAALSGAMNALGDPLVLQSSLESMQAQREQIEGEFAALSLAIDTLRQADAQIQSRFSPELGRVAAGYMSQMTGGRYSDVLINRDFTAKTRTADDAVARDCEYLSAGTLDLMYLAVRLAVCELALPDSGESCPLIIDDALVNLDEERFAQAMSLLESIARKRQVLFFTCRNK